MMKKILFNIAGYVYTYVRMYIRTYVRSVGQPSVVRLANRMSDHTIKHPQANLGWEPVPNLGWETFNGRLQSGHFLIICLGGGGGGSLRIYSH